MILYEIGREVVLPTVPTILSAFRAKGLPPMPSKELRIALRILGDTGVVQRAPPDTFFPT